MELATQELEAHGGAGRAAATLSAKAHLRLGEPRLQDAQSNVASIFTQRLDGKRLTNRILIQRVSSVVK